MPITKEQREQRRNYIGASDVPKIMGAKDAYGNALSVYKEKLGLTPPFTGNLSTEIGNLLEGPLLDFAADRLGYKIRKNQRRVNEIFAANVDALVTKLPIGMEAKTTTKESDWGEEGTDEVPDKVLLQVQTQMYCGDLDVVYVPALICGRFKLYRVEREESVIDAIVETGHQFWHDHVLKQVPPEGTDPADLIEIQRKAGKIVELPDDLAATYVKLKEQEKQVKELLEVIKPKLIDTLGDAEIGEWSGGYITCKEQGRANFDAKALREAHPDIYEQFNGEIRFPVIRQKAKS